MLENLCESMTFQWKAKFLWINQKIGLRRQNHKTKKKKKLESNNIKKVNAVIHICNFYFKMKVCNRTTGSRLIGKKDFYLFSLLGSFFSDVFVLIRRSHLNVRVIVCYICSCICSCICSWGKYCCCFVVFHRVELIFFLLWGALACPGFAQLQPTQSRRIGLAAESGPTEWSPAECLRRRDRWEASCGRARRRRWQTKKDQCRGASEI